MKDIVAQPQGGSISAGPFNNLLNAQPTGGEI